MHVACLLSPAAGTAVALSTSIAGILSVSRRLAQRLEELRFGPPVAHVYDPLVYAREPHEEYLRRFGARPGRILVLGVNSGPWGMAQTGVPFGDVEAVRDWMGIEGPVRAPPRPHARRPVTGFACLRVEVSGRRLWAWARERWGDPAGFFARFFVWNYCPLCFFGRRGENLTPDRLSPADRGPLYRACDAGLAELASALAPRGVIALGALAAERARAVLAGRGLAVVRAQHPSGRNPRANIGWADQVDAAVGALEAASA